MFASRRYFKQFMKELRQSEKKKEIKEEIQKILEPKSPDELEDTEVILRIYELHGELQNIESPRPRLKSI